VGADAAVRSEAPSPLFFPLLDYEAVLFHDNDVTELKENP